MRIPIRAVVAVASTSIVLAGTVAWAAIPSADGIVHGCYANSSGIALVNALSFTYSKGDVRIIDENTACRSYESAISWNAKGTKGDTGTTGPVGPQGPKGDRGAPGAGIAAHATVVVEQNLTGGNPKVYTYGAAGSFTADWVGAGRYDLTFASDVSACAMTVTPAELPLPIDDGRPGITNIHTTPSVRLAYASAFEVSFLDTRTDQHADTTFSFILAC